MRGLGVAHHFKTSRVQFWPPFTEKLLTPRGLLDLAKFTFLTIVSYSTMGTGLYLFYRKKAVT